MSADDPFEHDDAAYLLGALPAPERAAYERHLAGCAACRARLDSLRPVADELAGLDAGDLDGVADGPATDADHPGDAARELALLLAAVARYRRRRAWTVGALGAAAAAAIAAVIVVITVPGSSAPTQSPPQAQAMTALMPSPVTAQVSLRQAGWGTEVRLRCRYLAVSGYPGARVYDLVVVDRSGHRHALGSWTLSAGNRASFSSPVALPRDAIRLVQVTTADGTPILQLAP